MFPKKQVDSEFIAIDGRLRRIVWRDTSWVLMTMKHFGVDRGKLDYIMTQL